MGKTLETTDAPRDPREHLYPSNHRVVPKCHPMSVLSAWPNSPSQLRVLEHVRLGLSCSPSPSWLISLSNMNDFGKVVGLVRNTIQAKIEKITSSLDAFLDDGQNPANHYDTMNIPLSTATVVHLSQLINQILSLNSATLYDKYLIGFHQSLSGDAVHGIRQIPAEPTQHSTSATQLQWFSM